MQPAINAWTFRPGTSPEQMLEAAVQAGFAGIELTMGMEGCLTTATPQAECERLGRLVREAGLRVTGLATDLFWTWNYGDPNPTVRQQAREITRIGLDRAAWLGTDVLLVVPAVVGLWNSPNPAAAYSEALERSADWLVRLASEAEARQVRLAVENVWNRFLLSPVEMREFLDRINSPWVGAYFDVGNAMAFGYPQDWIRTLGRRIVRVHAKDYDLDTPGPAGFCPLREGSVNWSAVVAALGEVGYDGPLTYEGPGEPADIVQRLRQILASA